MTRKRTRRPRPLRPSWASRNYRLLTAAAVVTGLGSSGSLIAAAFAVLEAGGDGTDVGLVAAARTVPLVIFLLIGGAVADRLPRHQVMVAANVLNGVSQAVFAALVITDRAQLWQMALLSALGGTGQAFFAPAAEGMVLSSVGTAQPGRAFAVFRIGVNSAHIGGAALGGAMVSAVGPGWVLAVDAAAFGLAGALRALLDVSRVPRRAPGSSLLREFQDGWREVTSRRWLWTVIAQFAVVNAMVSAVEAVYGPQVALERLGGAGPWGLALAGLGAGTLGGAALMMFWKPRRLLLAATLGVFPLALPAVALALPLPVPALILVMFGTGVAIEVFGVSWMVALHQEIPEEKFSRVAAYDWLGSVAAIPVATALAGPVQDLVGRPTALWGSAALTVALTAATLAVPEVRRLTRQDPPPLPPAGAARAPELEPTDRGPRASGP